MNQRTDFREDWEHIITYMQEQAEDRTLAIVGAAYCERYSRALLEYRMPNLTSTISRDLFDGSAPLATASSRYRLCFAFGLIDDVTYGDVKILAKIRNRFAHHVEVRNCDDKKIGSLVASFSRPEPPERIAYWDEGDASSRLRWKISDLVNAFHNGLNAIVREGTANAKPASVIPKSVAEED